MTNLPKGACAPTPPTHAETDSGIDRMEYAEHDGLIDEANNPAHKVPKLGRESM